MKRSNGTTPAIGHVYAIDCGDKVKIGCSINPGQRTISLSNTLGLIDPPIYISKKCFDHYAFEKIVHEAIGCKSNSGEFFESSFDEVVMAIDSVVVEATDEEINFVEENNIETIKNIDHMTRDVIGIQRVQNLKSQSVLAYDAILKDAISWADSFGLDHTDKLNNCNGCLVSLMAESLKIHKAVISEYAKAIKEVK